MCSCIQVPTDMEPSKRSRKLKKDEDIALDAGVWGNLQDYIQLQDVYEKLPYQELFRLRVVCRAWYHVALQRLEPKPYFVMIVQGEYECGETEYLNGVLSYDVASNKYSFKRQRFPLRYSYSADVPFEVEGLIFCLHPDNLKQHGVFNIHNKTWHAIPPAPKSSEYISAIGMIVDTSERPYSFKLVVGSLDTKTQIYDSQSRSWTTTSSRLKQLAKPALSKRQIVTCMCNNGCVYISIGAEILLMYSMEGDSWTIVDFPEVKQQEDGGGGVHALGVWEGRIFTTRENCKKRNVTVWELVDQTKEEWVKYVFISGVDYDMLMKCDFESHGPSIYEDLRLVPCFCDGYLLIYNWHYSQCQSYALGMLNLATYEWEKVNLPPLTVAFEKVTEEDSEMEEGSDIEGGGKEDFDFEEASVEGSVSDEDSEEDEDSEVVDSDPGCATKAIRIRRKTFRSKVYFRRHQGADIVRSKIALHRQIDREWQLVMNQEAGIGAPLVTSGGISAKAEKLPSTMGNIVLQPTLAAKAANLFSSNNWMNTMTSNLAANGENPFSTTGKIIMKPSLDNFECAMCFFESNVPDDYEAHKKTKVHRVLEELHKDMKHKNPLTILYEYVTRNRLHVNYEIKNKTINFSILYEVIAIIGGASGGTAGPPTKGFGRHSKRQRAKQMAAADALERIMENVSESEFTNLARIGFVVGGRKRKGGGGGNSGANVGSGSGVGGGVGGNPGDSGGSGKGVGGGGGGNPGDSGGSGKGISEGGGNSGGNVGSGVGGGVGGNPGGSGKGVGGGGGNSGGNVGSGSGVGGGGGGNPGDSGGSGKGISEGGGNSGGNVGSGVGGGVGGNPGDSGGSGKGIGGGGGNSGANVGSGSGVGGGGGGNPGDSGGSGKGISEGGGNSGGNVGSGVGGGVGGNPGDSGGSGKGVGGGVGGNSGGNVGSGSSVGGGVGGNPGDSGCSGKGVGGGSYPSNSNAILVTGYNNDSHRAGNLTNNVDKHAGQMGTGYNMPWQGGRGGRPSRPEINSERKLEKLTESYVDRIQGGRGYGGGGYIGRKSFGRALGVGDNSYGGQDVGGIGYVRREPPALGYGGRGLHPGISAYGHQSQGSLVPHNIRQTQHMPIQNLSILPCSHVPAQYISTQYVQTQHALTQHVHTQQAAMWIPTVGGPGQGGTPYSTYDAAPQSSRVSTGTGQTATHTYSQQYAPTINYGAYGAYAVNQEYVVNTAVPVQEMAPGTSNATQSALVAQYGVMQPQQQVPQQRAVYALQGATQHQQS